MVSWKSRKKTIVACSSGVEVEYKAMAHTTSELAWLQHFLQDIGFPAPIPFKLFCDNENVVHIVSDLVFHKRTK